MKGRQKGTRNKKMEERIAKAVENQFTEEGVPTIIDFLQRRRYKNRRKIEDIKELEQVMKEQIRGVDRAAASKLFESWGYVPANNESYSTFKTKRAYEFFLNLCTPYFKGERIEVKEEVVIEPEDIKVSTERITSRPPKNDNLKAEGFIKDISSTLEALKKDNADFANALYALTKQVSVLETKYNSLVSTVSAREEIKPLEVVEEDINSKYSLKKLYSKKDEEELIIEAIEVIDEKFTSDSHRANFEEFLSEVFDIPEEEVKEDFSSMSFSEMKSLFVSA